MYIFFVCLFFFFNHTFPLGLLHFILTAGPLQPREAFAINVFVVMFIYNIGSFFHCACIAYRDMKHLESSTSTQRNYQNQRICTRKQRKFAGSRTSLLRVAQFVLKIAHLAISTEPCGPLACGLLSRLWLLIVPLIHTTSHSTILFLLEF